MSQPLYRPLDASTSDQFPAQALHACQVLAHLLQRVPRPESVQLFTADHWSAPWLQIHLYPDPDDTQLTAYQQAIGGLVTRSRRDGDARGVVYSELATEVDRVRIQVWNVNESPLPTLVPEWRPQTGVDGRAVVADPADVGTQAEAPDAPHPADLPGPEPAKTPAPDPADDGVQPAVQPESAGQPEPPAAAGARPAKTRSVKSRPAGTRAAGTRPAGTRPADDCAPVAQSEPADAP